MRQLEIKNIKTTNRGLDTGKYKQQAEDKRTNAAQEVDLLDEIKNGNRDAIPKLVDSCEYIIIRVIEIQIDDGSVLIEKMIDAGRAALTALAERKLGSTRREIFFRFGTWWVRKAIIKVLA